MTCPKCKGARVGRKGGACRTCNGAGAVAAGFVRLRWKITTATDAAGRLRVAHIKELRPRP